MPTGYTAKLMEHGQEFPDFVMSCARAFGACVMMRDDSMDTPIPDRFEPSDYHAKAEQEARERLALLKGMGVADRLRYGQARKAGDIASCQKYLEKNRAENQRLADMRAKVEAWTPPTKDHTELKTFMLKQIEASTNDGDYYETYINGAKAKEPLAYYTEALESAKSAVEQHIKEHAAEVGRANDRTRWVQQLRESLK